MNNERPPSSPFELYGHDRAEAERNGWRFEKGERGYNGNRPPYYAIDKDGHRFTWNNCMRHGGCDPWDYVGKW